jgi:hypothetical protein
VFSDNEEAETKQTASPKIEYGSSSSQRTSAPIDEKLEQKIAEDPRNALDL